MLVTKLKKRGRDSKKALGVEEKALIAAECRLFTALANSAELRKGYATPFNVQTSDGGKNSFGSCMYFFKFQQQ